MSYFPTFSISVILYHVSAALWVTTFKEDLTPFFLQQHSFTKRKMRLNLQEIGFSGTNGPLAP